MDEKLEQALALGFPSIEACEKHQVWLDGQRVMREKIHKEIEESRRTGVIDIRGIRQ